MTMGDRIVVMKDGLIQQIDVPQNLYDHPRNVFVAGFIGSPQMNFIDCVLKRDGDDYFAEIGADRLRIARAGMGEYMAAYAGKSVKVGIRPEDIYDDGDFLSKHADDVIEAEVEVKEMMGSEVYLYLNYKENRIIARVAPDTASAMGDAVKIGIDTRKIHIFDPSTEEAIQKT
jgi:multiple sugar transport system ATP-binding protein